MYHDRREEGGVEADPEKSLGFSDRPHMSPESNPGL